MKNYIFTALLVALMILFLADFDCFARSGGGRGSGGRGSYGGRSAATPSRSVTAPSESATTTVRGGANPSAARGFNPYHQPFRTDMLPSKNVYINNSPYFNPNAIPFNPMDGNDKVEKGPLYNYEDNFKNQH